MKHMHYHI